MYATPDVLAPAAGVCMSPSREAYIAAGIWDSRTVKLDVHCGRKQPRSKMVFAAVLDFTGFDNRLCNFFEPGVARIYLRSA